MTSSRPALSFSVVGSADVLSFAPERLIIAGYTARDPAAARAHIDELARIGVPPPPRVPMFYEVPAELATVQPAIPVHGQHTSGEVEPVLIRTTRGYFLGVGSDHTDRDVEMRDVTESKTSAPKPVGGQLVPLDRALADWDDIELSCRVDGAPYQHGRLASMLGPPTLLNELSAASGELGHDALMFCGTVPLLGGEFVFATGYVMELRLPDGTALTHRYKVETHD